MRHPTLTLPSAQALALALAVPLLAGCAAIPPAGVPPAPPQHRQLVVLDIDGTITPHNLHVLEVRAGAPQVLQAYASKGYQIVYITTRVPLFQWFLPRWLADNGLPPGALHVAQDAAERGDPAAFKAGVLARYSAAGWTPAYAYGDSPSDFDAYARAGMPAARVFALQRRYADACTAGPHAACLATWEAHLPFVEREVPPSR